MTKEDKIIPLAVSCLFAGTIGGALCDNGVYFTGATFLVFATACLAGVFAVAQGNAP